MSETIYKGYPQWYKELNKSARLMEAEIAWPDARQEEWRRTDLKRVDLQALYRESPTPPEAPVERPQAFPPPQAKDRILSMTHVKEAIAGDFPGARELMEAHFKGAGNRFMLRLLSETPRGVYFYLPRDYTSSEILFLEDQLNQTRGESFSLNIVVLEENAQLELWERIHGDGSEALVHNRATLFLLNKGARLKYYRTQTLNPECRLFDFSRALIKEGAEFYSYQAEKEIYFNKSHMTAELLGRHAHAELRGIYHIKKDNFCELFTEQIHSASKGVSHALYRGVLEDAARTVYNGMIKVTPEAVGTDAYLTNNNLLMNDGCRADSIPGLKIATNEVKCSHGSTTGKVDLNQLFYLTSRGFSPEEGKKILTQAFLEEVMDGTPDLVKREIEKNWDLEWEAV